MPVHRKRIIFAEQRVFFLQSRTCRILRFMLQLVSFETLMEYFYQSCPLVWYFREGERLTNQSVFRKRENFCKKRFRRADIFRVSDRYMRKRDKGNPFCIHCINLRCRCSRVRTVRLLQSGTCDTALCFLTRGKREIFLTYRSI